MLCSQLQNPTNTVLRSSKSNSSATQAAQLSGDKEPQDRIGNLYYPCKLITAGIVIEDTKKVEMNPDFSYYRFLCLQKLNFSAKVLSSSQLCNIIYSYKYITQNYVGTLKQLHLDPTIMG